MFRKFISTTFFFLSVLYISFGQEQFSFSVNLDWSQELFVHPLSEKVDVIPTFEDAYFNEHHHTLPTYGKRFQLPGDGHLEVNISNPVYESFDREMNKDNEFLSSEIILNSIIEQERNDHFANIFFVPIIHNGSDFERLINFTINVRYIPKTRIKSNSRNTQNSLLKDGLLYKIAVEEAGVYKLDRSFFENIEGLDINNTNPLSIQVLGNEGGVLPEKIATERIDDVAEMPIYFSGNTDASFDSDEYFLFWAEGPSKVHYDDSERRLYKDHNYYDDFNHYFIKIGSTEGKRISNVPNITNTEFSDGKYDDVQRFDEDLFNLLGELPSVPGSGKRWYGEKYVGGNTQTFQDKFDFTDIVTPSEIYVELEFASRSESSTSLSFSIGEQSSSISFPGQNFSDEYNNYANNRKLSSSYNISSDDIIPTLNYPPVSSGNEGWIDYIQINLQKNLVFKSNWLNFRSISSTDYSSTTLIIEDGIDAAIWDITDIANISEITGEISGNSKRIGFNSSDLKEFVAVDLNGVFPSPQMVGAVANQNLHGISDLAYLIIYHDEFKEAAEQLANFRKNNEGLNTLAVPLSEIYNEFSGGSEDLTAIRDFARMLLKRTDNFKYMLLLGDGSFDYKHIKKTYDDENFVPVYQTSNSLHPINAYPSDDYYALLSDNEGANLKGALDIAVGRLPARSIEEANLMVNKIVNYETAETNFGDWRLRLGFLADDEDHNDHAEQADDIANLVQNKFPEYNIEKIYFDAYKQASFSGGERFPDANKAINDNMFRGLLALNYLGHGGPNGWAQERVLLVDDINRWTNEHKLPLFVTATCTFTGFDDPKITSAGEYTLLNESGGTIALFSTVRAVISAYNKRLAQNVFDTMFVAENGTYQRLGEVLRSAKNVKADTSGGNARKFLMIGDPAMNLAIPSKRIKISKINGKDVGLANIDTLSAFETGKIEGFIEDQFGSPIPNFNGLMYTTIFDKEKTVQTLGQDPKSQPPLPYNVRKNIVFKGVTSIENGQFSIDFIVPKDINYDIGNAKISLYAKSDQNEDAAGFSYDLKIGGSSTTSINDDQGPEINLYMNDESFVWGGLTDENPILLVKLKDDFGINITGNSIGHDLSATLDNDNSKIYILNDYYEGEVNDFTAGMVRFPLTDLDTGWHEISVRAWDIANNTSESRLKFYVGNQDKASVTKLYNYPNPFSNNTEFMFEHNLSNVDFNAQIQIFTVAGRLIKTIDHYEQSQGYRVSGLFWDGLDDYGDPLSNGVYIYKVKLNTIDDSGGNISVQSPFQKLVILK